jgi:hypothetical protein
MNTSEEVFARLWKDNASAPALGTRIEVDFEPRDSHGAELVCITGEEVKVAEIQMGTVLVYSQNAESWKDLSYVSEFGELGVLPIGPHVIGSRIRIAFIVGSLQSGPVVSVVLRSPMTRELPPPPPSRLEDGATKLLETVARVLEAKP